MSGKRLLDAIQVLNVAKSVATKHLAARQRQIDVFTRTSSLTKGVKSQAEGVILTAQAAAALARRFNEPSPPYSTKQSESTTTPPSASRDAAKEPGRDEFANKSEWSSGSERSPSLSPDEAKKLQRQAEFQIPASTATHSAGTDGLDVSQQQDVFYKPSQESTPELSSLPRVKLPHSTGDDQGRVGPDINADVFHSPLKDGRTSASDEKEEFPDEMMKDIFHSPKVARMLSPSGSDAKRSDWRTSRYARRPAEKGPDSNSRTDINQSEKKDMENLGSNIAENVASPEVRTRPGN